jgi:hypothetical protein
MNKKNIFKVAFVILCGLMVHWLCGNIPEGIAYCVLGGLFAKKTKVPKPIDIWKKKLPQQQAAGMLGYYGEYVPKFLELEKSLTPQFIEQRFTAGEQALGGLLGLQDIAGADAAQRMAELRAQELGAMTGQTGLFRGFVGALSPEQEAMVQASTAEAQRASTSAQGVTPEEQRMYQQTAREAFQASGRLGGNAAIAAEVMGRENVMAQKRAEADAARQRAFSQAGQFYTAPGISMLGATPASYGAGTSLAGTGLGLGESMSPQFDYNAPIGLGLQRASALDQQRLAQAQADAQHRSARLASIGSLIGLAAMPFTGGLSAGLGLTGLAGGAAGATGMSGLGLSAGMGLANMFGGVPRATPVAG